MTKLLIADSDNILAQAISRQLRGEFEILQCDNGETALKYMRKYQPDILLIDLHLTRVDGLEVLRTIRSCGLSTRVVATTYVESAYLLNELSQLQVSNLYKKPCSIGAVVSCLRDMRLSGDTEEWSESREANKILLELGFRMGLARYHCVYQALLLKYQGEDGGITKCLYPKVARLYGGNTAQVEKAIRDAIKDAFSQGNPSVWQMYFPPGRDGVTSCPSNEVFLARIAYALQERFAMRMPCKKAQ